MIKHLIRKTALRTIAPMIALLSVVLLSGCMWGVVRDASTDAPLAGVNVTYTDANGGSATATTDANGLFAFDQATGPYPAMGPASFHLSAAGYEDLTAARLMEYNDHEGATLSNLSTFWEVQTFNLVEHTVQMVNIELKMVDLDAAQLAPPMPIVNTYAVGLKVYDPADMTTPLCEQVSPAQVYTSTNPPASNLSLNCDIPGDRFAAKITVVAQQMWDPPGPQPPLPNVDVSTIGYEWTAPSPNTSWQTVTLGSSDATGPDDSDLSFQAQIRYRAKVESGP